jgi:hypothetical protein
MTYTGPYARPLDRIAVRTLCGLFAPRRPMRAMRGQTYAQVGSY